MNDVEFCGLERMDRSVTSGVTTAGALALAQHFLSSAEPRVDWSLACPPGVRDKLDPWSFVLGLTCGIFLFAAIEAFVTLRWCITSVVQRHLVAGSESIPRKHFKFLNEQ